MVTRYKDLTLAMYLEIDGILRDEWAEEIDKQVSIIAILDGKDPAEVLALPLADYAAMAAQTAFLREVCKPVPYEGKALGNLQPVTDFRELTTAQYVDFQTFAKRLPSSLPEVMGIFLVPEGCTYGEGYDTGEVVERLRLLPWPEALGMAAFFLQSFAESIRDLLTYSEASAARTKDPRKRKALERKIREVQALLKTAGAGLPT